MNEGICSGFYLDRNYGRYNVLAGLANNLHKMPVRILHEARASLYSTNASYDIRSGRKVLHRYQEVSHEFASCTTHNVYIKIVHDRMSVQSVC